MNKCLTRRIPTNPGVSLALNEKSRLSVTKTGRHTMQNAPDLPAGFWLTDLRLEEVQLMCDKKINRIIHPDGWIGAQWKQIGNEIGFKDNLSQENIHELAEISERIIRLSVQAITKADFWRKSEQQISNRRTFERISLAMGLSDYIGPFLKNTRPREHNLCIPSHSLLLYGAGSRVIDFQKKGRIIVALKPRFSHLSWLATQPLPGAGAWQQIKLPKTQVPLTNKTIIELIKFQRPVIVNATFQPTYLSHPSWCHAWMKGPDPNWGRQWFTLQEVNYLMRAGKFYIQAAYVGPRKSDQESEGILSRVAKGLVKACGGKKLIRYSWSGGFASHNLIHATCSKFNSKNAPVSTEAIWNAANDRIACVSAIEAAEAVGGKFLSSVAGMVSFKVGNSNETAQVIQALWKEGFHLPPGLANDLKNEGVKYNIRASNFGGQKEDLLLALASQHGMHELVRSLDRSASSTKRLSDEKINHYTNELLKYSQ